jgi:hypothetical protein
LKRQYVVPLFALILLCTLNTLICDAQPFISDKAVRGQVLRVKSNPSDIGQAAAAEDLFDLVKDKKLSHVRPETIHMIAISSTITLMA